MKYIYVITLLAVCLYFYIDIKKYDVSEYKYESGLPYIKAKFNTGYRGEHLSFEKLESLEGHHRTLVNVYVPKDDNGTTEIDLVYIHETGIYVIESKNYSGWIFGSEKNKTWRQTFKTGRKEQFYNPIWQNNTHIKYLSQFLSNLDIKLFRSIIVFSERCTLRNIEVYSENVKVINRYDLISTMKDIIGRSEKIFTEDRVNEIYYRLKALTNVSETVKLKHIEKIKERINQ